MTHSSGALLRTATDVALRDNGVGVNGEFEGKNLRNVASLVTSLQETAEELGEEVSVLFQQCLF